MLTAVTPPAPAERATNPQPSGLHFRAKPLVNISNYLTVTVRLTSNLTLTIKYWLCEWVWCVRTKKLPQLSKTSCSVRLISNKQLFVLLGNGGNWNTIIFSIITGTYHIAQQDPISVSMTLMIINANLFGQNWTSCKDLIHSLIPSFQDTFQKQSKVLLSLQTLERHI